MLGQGCLGTTRGQRLGQVAAQHGHVGESPHSEVTSDLVVPPPDQ